MESFVVQLSTTTEEILFSKLYWNKH